MSTTIFENAFRNHDTLRRLDRFQALADRVVFVFFDPWTLLTQTAGPLLDAILAHGFSVAAMSRRRLEEGDVEQIYRKNLPIRPDNAWHIPRQVYLMGTSLGLLVHHRSAKATDLLRSVKGKANPAANSPGMLRYDFRAPNRSLSLLHSSDTWEDTLHEALVFFDTFTLERTLDLIERQEPHALDPAATAWDRGLELIRDASPASLLLRVRLRAAGALVGSCAADSPALRCELDSLSAFWQERLAAADARRPVPAEIRGYLEVVERERPRLRAAAAALARRPLASAARLAYPRLYHHAADPAGDLLRLLLVLNRPEEYVHVDAAALCRSLGVLQDRWEELLFTTTLFNFDDFLS